MATKLISAAAPPPVFGDGTVVRWAAGSSNLNASPAALAAAVAPTPGAAPTRSTRKDPAPESVGNDAWARTVAAREAAEGLATKAVRKQEAEPATRVVVPGGLTHYDPDAPRMMPVYSPADLSGLPDSFALEVQRKPDGWWVVRAPTVHVGLFVAHRDLQVAMADAPGALAAILRLDGQMPQPKAGRKRRGDS